MIEGEAAYATVSPDPFDGKPAELLNSRPRKTLGWKMPAEALDQFLYSAQQGGVATTP